MITLNHDSLTFTFPKIGRQLRELVEAQIQKIASLLPPCWARAELLAEIESNRLFERLSPAAQEKARVTVQNWTHENVEEFLREAVVHRSGLSTDSFTELTIKFQRAMRLPDDGREYRLPTGLGQYPLRSVDDFSRDMPPAWKKSGGVVMPLARSEAVMMWFSSRCRFAVRIATGATDPLSGLPWSPEMRRDPQNYLLAPNPPWDEHDEVVRRLVMTPLTDSGPI